MPAIQLEFRTAANGQKRQFSGLAWSDIGPAFAGWQRRRTGAARALPPALEHFPAKWKPVRRRKCDHDKKPGATSDPTRNGVCSRCAIHVAGR